jgi:hypothetical protein
MHISPISSYRSNPYNKQTFTGIGLKTALLLGTIGAVSLVAAPKIMAQTATPVSNTTTTEVVENATKKKPYVFKDLTREFFISKDEKLTIGAANMKGDTIGYDFIRVNIYDYLSQKTTQWWLVGLTEPASDMHRTPWITLAKLGEKDAKPLGIFDEKVVSYVLTLLEDSRNLTGAKVVKAAGTLAPALK